MLWSLVGLEIRKMEKNESQSNFPFYGIWALKKNYTVLEYTKKLSCDTLIWAISPTFSESHPKLLE